MPHAHVLSSSLVGGGSMNPDKLSLDLNFAADKSFSKPSTLGALETQITSRRGPAPVFSRGSMGTMVGSTGLIEYGPENLTYPSELLTNGPTNVVLNRIAGDSIFPNPVFISETTNGTNQIHRVFTGTSGSNTVVGQTYIEQFFIKANGRNFVYFNNSIGSVQNTINLSDGTFTNNNGWTSIYLGNGWYKIISPVWTAGIAAAGYGIQLNNSNVVGDTNYIGDITKGILFAGHQRERYSTARQYIPTTTGAVYGPRFDHDPITLSCKGLLIEEGRTNLLWPSDTLTTQTRTVTAVAHTLSFYGTGTVVLSGTAIATVSGTGAYPTRTTLTFTPTAGSLILTVTGSVVFAQLEAGSFPTSYIPTTTGTAARSADVCSITDMGFYNQSFGTFLISASRAPFALTGDYNNIVRIGDGTNNNRVGIGLYGNHTTSNTSLEVFYTAGGTSSINLQRNSSNSKFKGVIAYQSGDFAICFNGSTPLTTSTSTNIMSNGSNTVQFGSIKQIYIESIQFYKKRIANAKLQTLTA